MLCAAVHNRVRAVHDVMWLLGHLMCSSGKQHMHSASVCGAVVWTRPELHCLPEQQASRLPQYAPHQLPHAWVWMRQSLSQKDHILAGLMYPTQQSAKWEREMSIFQSIVAVTCTPSAIRSRLTAAFVIKHGYLIMSSCVVHRCPGVCTTTKYIAPQLLCKPSD